MIEKWLLSALAIIGAFSICGIGGAYLAHLAGLWNTPIAGFMAAFSVVSVAYLSAPKRPEKYALTVFVLGVVTAYLVLNDVEYPEAYGELAYQTSLLPFISTVGGGLFALAIIILPQKKRIENA